MTQDEYDERVAIAVVDGGVHEREAHRMAVEQCCFATKEQCPDAWGRLNRWWHGLCA